MTQKLELKAKKMVNSQILQLKKEVYKIIYKNSYKKRLAYKNNLRSNNKNILL